MTVTGGEPLMQAEFSQEVLAKCRQDGIRTAIKTSGFGSQSALLEIAQVCDLIYNDIKALDDGLHTMYTGVGNKDGTCALQHLCRCKIRVAWA